VTKIKVEHCFPPSQKILFATGVKSNRVDCQTFRTNKLLIDSFAKASVPFELRLNVTISHPLCFFNAIQKLTSAMKRTASSTDFKDIRSLKRANSSLFSIATLVDDEHHLLGNSTSSISFATTDQVPNGLVPDDNTAADGDALCIDSDESCTDLPFHVSGASSKSSKIQSMGRKSNLKEQPLLKIDSTAATLNSHPVSLVSGGDSGEDCPPSDDGILSSCSSSDIDMDETLEIDVDDSQDASKHVSLKITPEVLNGEVKDRSPTTGNITSPIDSSASFDNAHLCVPCNDNSNLRKKGAVVVNVELSTPEDNLIKDVLPDTNSLRMVESTDITEAARTESVKSPPTNQGSHQTGLVFESGSKHFDRHNRFHKERPLRVTSIHDYLLKSKLNDDNGATLVERCHILMPNEGVGHKGAYGNNGKSSEELFLDNDDYLRVHLPGYMQRLDRIAKCTCNDRLDIEGEQFKSIYFTRDSVREAKAAASSLCRLVTNVVSGNLDNGFAVIRPPGHHAEPGLAGGYCVINNVAVAAAYAREKLGVKKVLIVDWDVHHGNGTQKCFIDNPNVMYFSVHRYHGGNFFPFLDHGGPNCVGNNEGKGFNMNIGWNNKKMGDDEYLVVWEKLLMPVANEFKPDLVLVSAGFDAARGDMGECDVTPECFARLTRRLKTLANGKVVCALEGGYVRSVLCKCVETVLSALLDSESEVKCKQELQTFYKKLGEMDMLDCIDPSASKSIMETIKAHSPYWECLHSPEE